MGSASGVDVKDAPLNDDDGAGEGGYEEGTGQQPNLITLREAAALLGLTAQRVYQMDDELSPVITPRGTKMKVRHYRRDTIEQFRAERTCQVTGVHSPGVQALHRRAAREALRQGVIFELSLDEYVEIGMLRCILCGVVPRVRESANTLAALHDIIRVVHDHPLNRENAAPACERCLISMSDMDVRAYIAHCRTVVAWHERLGAF